MTKREKERIGEALDALALAGAYTRTANPRFGGRPAEDLPRIRRNIRDAESILAELVGANLLRGS